MQTITKLTKKGMIKVLILNFFNQQTLQWMLANIVYYNTCVNCNLTKK